MADTAADAPGETSQGVREFTWPNYIGWGGMIVQARMEADWKGLWDYAIPHPHATEENVVRTEAHLGFRLPESYRGFLLAADGWPYLPEHDDPLHLRPAGRRPAQGRPDPARAGRVRRSRPWPPKASSPQTTSPWPPHWSQLTSPSWAAPAAHLSSKRPAATTCRTDISSSLHSAPG